MKVKCPECGKALSIPDSAAGKLVKCSCGKQLRAPGGATKPGNAKRAAAKPGQPKPAAKPAAPAPELDEDLFGELTDQDLTPVKSVYNPGQKPTQATGPSEETNKKSNKKLIVIVVIAVLLLIGIGVGVAGWLLGWFGGSSESAGTSAMILTRLV